jgi:membrane protein required for colicin V production
MGIFDIIVIIPVIWFAYKGFKNGLIKELGTLAALILGIWGAVRFSGFTAEYINTNTNAPLEYIPLIAFGLTFLVIVIVVFLLAQLLNKFIDTLKLEWLNKAGGMFFGIAKILLIIGAILFVVNQVNSKHGFITKDFQEKSLLYQPLSDLMETAYPYIKKIAFDTEANMSDMDIIECSDS